MPFNDQSWIPTCESLFPALMFLCHTLYQMGFGQKNRKHTNYDNQEGI